MTMANFECDPPVCRPKISIMVITYNHEQYIAQALESILMQETEFVYEIVVIEDCSTDKTQEIIMEYVKKYPDKVKPFFNKKNIGYKITQKNFYQGYFKLTGEYMAILEGDDYWTSPHKLQKQVSFLEKNPEYVACAHNTLKIYTDGSREPHRFLYYDSIVPDHALESFIMLHSYFHTTTLLFRNVFRGAPPLHFRNKWSCEIFMVIAHAQFGKIRYFNDDMAVYRAHSGGRFSNMGMLEGWFFNIGGLRRYNQWLKYRYLKTFSRSIVRYCNNLLLDKGEQAALPSRYQYLKYLAIRTVYQIIYAIMLLLEWLCETFIKSFKLTKALSTVTANKWLVIILWPLAISQRLLDTLSNILYRTINALCPVVVRDSIRRFEARHASVRDFRKMIIERRVVTRNGLMLCTNAVSVAFYKLARSILPEFIKNGINTYELAHPKIMRLRKKLAQGRLFK